MVICTDQSCGFNNGHDSNYCEMCGTPLKRMHNMTTAAYAPHTQSVPLNRAASGENTRKAFDIAEEPPGLQQRKVA